jgi:hypothetical protein
MSSATEPETDNNIDIRPEQLVKWRPQGVTSERQV